MDVGYWSALIIFSAVGMGYFVYGKKQAHIPALVAGIALCVYPYFFENVWMMWLVGAVLTGVPFFWRE